VIGGLTVLATPEAECCPGEAHDGNHGEDGGEQKDGSWSERVKLLLKGTPCTIDAPDPVHEECRTRYQGYEPNDKLRCVRFRWSDWFV